MRVSDAAAHLGVAASTAHRLLAMLVHRGFADQLADRRYAAGHMLRPAEPTLAPVALLRQVALPYLDQLVATVGESVHLVVLAGTWVRFAATVECQQILRVTDRAGHTQPAHLSSGGLAVLSMMPSEEVDELYQGQDDVDLRRLHRELATVRRRRFAINDQRTEAGVSAVGVAIRQSGRCPVAAVAIAMPTVRFARDRIPSWVQALTAAVAGIESDLETHS